LLWLASGAAAQTPAQKGSYLKNIEQCNKADTASLDVRIEGCTAFIDARQGTKIALVESADPIQPAMDIEEVWVPSEPLKRHLKGRH
jgi:hypothetical protein